MLKRSKGEKKSENYYNTCSYTIYCKVLLHTKQKQKKKKTNS